MAVILSHWTACATQSVQLAWNPSTNSTVAGYKIYYGTVSHVYTNSIGVGNVTNATMANLSDGTTYYFAATAYSSSGTESQFSNEVNYKTPSSGPTNTAPLSLDALANLTVLENTNSQAVALSGIGLGASTQLAITAVSSNPKLIPNPTVNYISPNSTGTLTFTPVANVNGRATISVTLNNGQAKNNLLTRKFTVTVVGLSPAINTLTNLTLSENTNLQTIYLSGVSLGTGKQVTITAVSSNPKLIPNPVVNYTSPHSTGTLTFTPIANVNGNATISVTLDNGQSKENRITEKFKVSVVGYPPSLDEPTNLTLLENTNLQTVHLSGIAPGTGKQLTITAVSSNPKLISNPIVNYTSPNSTGTLTFTPVANANGNATISVTLDNGQSKENRITKKFKVSVVGYPPTINELTNLVLIYSTNMQTVHLSGISLGTGKQLMVTAVSSNSKLISNPTVHYTSPNSTGTLTFTPLANVNGKAIITLTLDNGQSKENRVTTKFAVTMIAANTTSSTGEAGNSTNNFKAAAVPATLASSAFVQGQFSFDVSGASGGQYIVEASTDLVNWVPIQTNSAPFKFVDPDASHFSQRFYRTVPVSPPGN